MAFSDAEQLRTRVWIWGALQEGYVSTVHECDNFNGPGEANLSSSVLS